jgi:diguanylate cyclase (GGDEF)-like protein/putative nucleotidyltransferase with HDIG domain
MYAGIQKKIRDQILMECMGFEDTFKLVDSSLKEFSGDSSASIMLALPDPESPDFYFLFFGESFMFDSIRNKYPISDDLVGYSLKHLEEFLIIDDASQFCQQHNLRCSEFSNPVSIAPVKMDLEIYGILLCSAFIDDDKMRLAFYDFQQILADAVSCVLKKLYRYESIRQELMEMRVVSNIEKKIYGARNLDDLLREIVNNIVDKLGFDRSLISLVDEKSNCLVGRVTRGYEKTLKFVIYNIITSDDLLAEVVRTGKSRVITEIEDESCFPDYIKNRSDICQCVIVPLVLPGGKVLGTLSADHKKNQGQINNHRLIVLEELAGHAGIAIQNANLYEQVEYMAVRDGLTQVFNRQYFNRVMKSEISRVKRYNQPLSLLMLDVCDFKKFNDSYGHVVGDDILRNVAKLLMDNIREADIVARYGGDEFVVLMPNTSDEQAQMVMDRIERSALLHNRNESDPRKQFRISVGLKSTSAYNVDDILKEADEAMYKGRKEHVKQSLLYSLVADDAHQVERWDRFIANILKILREKESHYHKHSRRVMNYAIKICQLLNTDNYFLEIMSIAALLHDIGKISISSELLGKAGTVTGDEYNILKSHVALGVDLLRGADYLKEVCDIIYSHHERWDGKTEGSFPGYPEGKSGDGIPLGARILKVADSYDAMTSFRPYSPPMKNDDAIRELLNNQGKCFDPAIVKVFVPYLRTITSTLSTSFLQ